MSVVPLSCQIGRLCRRASLLFKRHTARRDDLRLWVYRIIRGLLHKQYEELTSFVLRAEGLCAMLSS